MTNPDLLAYAEARLSEALRSRDPGEIASARLLRTLIQRWTEARRAAIIATQGDGAPIDTGSLDEAVAAVARALGAPFGASLSEDLLDVIDAAYTRGRDEVSAAISFSEVDERAIAWLHRNSTYFVSTYHDRQLSDAVKAAGEDVIRRGLSRKEAGEAFAAALQDITGTRSAAYWEGFAVVTVGRAQEFGRTEAYARTGTEEVVIDAVRDSRTSCQCRYLDGKRIPVAGLVAQRDALVVATDPEAVRALAPWPTCDNVARLYAEGKIGAPPYHMACRTRTRVVLDTDA